MELNGLADFLGRGGPAMWLIALLSVVTLALILWKTWRFMQSGAWAGQATEQAVRAWCKGGHEAALTSLARRHGLRARLASAAMRNRADPHFSPENAREETTREARAILNEARGGLRALELIATIAPLIGLLGTVLGMIEAFQALQDSGNQADPAVLAGGIWQALLTTAAGMAVAIPASMALTWFESVVDHVQADMEDAATRIFTAPAPTPEIAALRA